MWWVLRASFTSCWALPRRRNMSSVARIAIQMCPTCVSAFLPCFMLLKQLDLPRRSDCTHGRCICQISGWGNQSQSGNVQQHGSILKFTFLNYRAFVLHFWLAYRIITYNAVLFPRLMYIQIHVIQYAHTCVYTVHIHVVCVNKGDSIHLKYCVSCYILSCYSIVDSDCSVQIIGLILWHTLTANTTKTAHWHSWKN